MYPRANYKFIAVPAVPATTREFEMQPMFRDRNHIYLLQALKESGYLISYFNDNHFCAEDFVDSVHLREPVALKFWQNFFEFIN